MQPSSGFALPLSTQGQRWSGFYRSEQKKKGNRYDAKCKYCLIELTGKPEKLHQHVLRCSNWPASEKTAYLQKIADENPTSQDCEDTYQSPTQGTILDWYSRPLSQNQSEKLHQKLLKAIVYGNIPFCIVENPYLQSYLRELNPSYNPPSRDMIKGRLLTQMFSDHIQKKLNKLPTLTDLTISLDGWTDNARNSIYGFMALKEHQEFVLDILDLSAHHHTSDFLKNKVKDVLSNNGIKMSSTIAVITDNASNMDKMRRLLNEEYSNIIPIRCCLHVFNLIVKDIVSFYSTASVCKKNQKLVNFFNSSHIWRRELQNWQKNQGINHSLATFCETRWYSLAKVCMEVSTYEQGFQHCLSLSEASHSKYSEIENAVVKNLIRDKYHFATNDTLMKVIKPVVDAIGRLESNDSILADVFKELIHIHQQISQLEVPINGFQAHALFDKFAGNAPLLRHLATKVFAIVPHGAGCERLFSSLGLIKSKVRNKLTPDNLSIIGQLRSELKKKVSTEVTKQNKIVPELSTDDDRGVDIFFDEAEENEQLEDLNEELEEIFEQDEVFFLEEFFDFAMYEKDQELFEDLVQFNVEQDDQLLEEKDWSIDDILLGNK
ncbi:5717_t:CDS:2 [Cetraspora pellucida]|uniref:5717_t:CDS:1 n=1 Tax=Cetraspora pellucida TaxID=1433469 RepID=A0ACA9JXQ3_9GLOM|nr:5717_t:CDS:2 [Cetraspora pellucida]